MSWTAHIHAVDKDRRPNVVISSPIVVLKTMNNALIVKFVEELFPSDFLIWDTRPEDNSYKGRKHPMFTALERENPGEFAELDIVKFLHRVFKSDQIFLNPTSV